MTNRYIGVATLAAIAFHLAPRAQAQCNVSTYETEGGYVHVGEYETLQRPTDFIDGWRAVQARLALIDDRAPGGSQMVMSIGVAAYRQTPLVPRRAQISFAGAPALSLAAERCSVERVGEAVVEQCDYRLNGYDATHFGENDIRSISVTDHRQGLTLDARPSYPALLKEQFVCLGRASLARP